MGGTKAGTAEAPVVSARPPRLAEWLVQRSLPVDESEREAVLGDLAEEHAVIARRSRARADAWYWGQTARSILPNLQRRLTRPARRSITPRRKGDIMDSILQDFRYAGRMLRRRPAMTAVALASLIIGISLSAVVFSLLNAVLLRPLPVEDPDRLAVMLEQRKTSVNRNFSYPDFLDYGAAQRSFEEMAAYSRADVTLRDGDASRVIGAELVSGGFFEMLGVPLRFGRGLTHEDDRPGGEMVVVVGESLWQRIGGGEAFAPRTIVLNQREFAIVGVAAARFSGVEVGRDAVIWAPLHARPVLAPGGRSAMQERRMSWLTVIGRLRPGFTRERAAADLNAAEAALAPAVGRTAARTLMLAPGRQGDSRLPETAGRPLALLLGAAVLVLLVACANVANLLLARATERSRELAVRSALGAGRARLARLVLIETLLIGMAGAAIGTLAARWLAELAVPLMARFGEPVTLDVSLDWRVLAFAVTAGLAATILTGLAPVLGILRVSPAKALADGSRSASAGPAGARTRRGLIVVQFALSLALVMAAALLARTVYNLRSIPTGFDIDHGALATIDPAAAQMDPARAGAYISAAIESVSRLPGVTAAGFGRVIPLGFGGSRAGVSIPGYEPAPDEDMELNYNIVSPGYFDALGIAMADGRPFDERDRADHAPVVIVNATMAARYWPGSRAVGQRVIVDSSGPPAEIVGVVGDVKYRMLREQARPSFYRPLAQQAALNGVIHVRTEGNPDVLLPALRRTLAAVDSRVPVTGVRTLREQASLNLNDERVAMLIGVTLGLAALVLAAVGLYGSMSYAISQRTRELGVRIALGASAGDIRRLVLGQGVGVSLAGTVLGVGLAIVLARTLENRLFGVTATDVPTLAISAAVLAAVALVASWVPAHRAGKVNPVDALRI